MIDYFIGTKAISPRIPMKCHCDQCSRQCSDSSVDKTSLQQHIYSPRAQDQLLSIEHVLLMSFSVLSGAKVAEDVTQ